MYINNIILLNVTFMLYTSRPIIQNMHLAYYDILIDIF